MIPYKLWWVRMLSSGIDFRSNNTFLNYREKGFILEQLPYFHSTVQCTLACHFLEEARQSLVACLPLRRHRPTPIALKKGSSKDEPLLEVGVLKFGDHINLRLLNPR